MSAVLEKRGILHKHLSMHLYYYTTIKTLAQIIDAPTITVHLTNSVMAQIPVQEYRASNLWTESDR